MARDYYKILGVERDASAQELKRAYHKLARELHPDVNPSPEASERFKEITSVYEVLSDPEKRRIVDLGGDPLESGSQGAGGFGGFDGFSGFSGSGLEDVFEAFFGGGGGHRGPRSRVQPGNDALLRIKISLAESITGVTKEVTIDTATICPDCQGSGTHDGSQPTQCPVCHGAGETQTVQRSLLGNVLTSTPCRNCQGTGEVISDPCRTCKGDGRVRVNRSLDVKIPAGVAEGMRIRMRGEGEVGPGGGTPGDLYIEILESEDPVFTREGDDLHCTVQISAIDAALGVDVVLETPTDGEKTVHIAPGTQPGEHVTLQGQGIPRLRTETRGDLHVHADIRIPEISDDEGRELLDKLRTRYNVEPHVRRTDEPARHEGFFSKIKSVFTGQN